MICFEIDDRFPWSKVRNSKIINIDIDDDCITFYCECGVFSINWTKTDLRDIDMIRTKPCHATTSPGCCLEHYGCGDEYCGDCYPKQNVKVSIKVDEIVDQCIKNIVHTVENKFKIELTNDEIIDLSIESTTKHDLFVFLGEIAL